MCGSRVWPVCLSSLEILVLREETHVAASAFSHFRPVRSVYTDRCESALIMYPVEQISAFSACRHEGQAPECDAISRGAPTTNQAARLFRCGPCRPLIPHRRRRHRRCRLPSPLTEYVHGGALRPGPCPQDIAPQDGSGDGRGAHGRRRRGLAPGAGRASGRSHTASPIPPPATPRSLAT